MFQRSTSPTMHSPMPSSSCSCSSSHGRSLSQTRDTLPTGQTTSSTKYQQDHFLSEQCHKHHCHDFPRKWIAHPSFPASCATQESLHDIQWLCTTCWDQYCCKQQWLQQCSGQSCWPHCSLLWERTFLRPLHQVDHLHHQHDDLVHNLAVVCEEIVCLLQGNLSQPTTTHNKACNSKGPNWHQWGCPWVRDSPRLDLLMSLQQHILLWGGCRQSLLLLLPPPPLPLPHTRGRSVKPPLCLPTPSSCTRTSKWTIQSRALMPLTSFRELCSQNLQGKSLRSSYWETTVMPKVFALSLLAWAITFMCIKERWSPTLN